MQRGEIILGYFPYGDRAGMKLRPLLLLTGPVGPFPEIVAAYVSSVIPRTLLESDMILDGSLLRYQSTRLKVVSVLRLHKIATIHAANFQRYIGRLSDVVQQEVDEKLRTTLRLETRPDAD